VEVDAPRILLVEDDPNDILLLERALRRLRPGTALMVARDGDEAIRHLAGEGPFAERSRYPIPSHVLLDLKLPKRLGLDVLEWIRRHSKLRTLRVVVLTSSREPEDLERVHRARVDLYCVKPPTFPELVKTLRDILEHWGLLP
jgi:CheY-like chemotaxis protein